MKINKLWIKFIGEIDEFSFENRVFNAVQIVAFVALGFTVVSNYFLGLKALAAVTALLSLVLVYLYYRSRIKKEYKKGIIVFNIVSYILLVSGYYLNSGINGPIIFCFFLTLQLIIAIAPPKQHLLWLSLHVVIVSGLMFMERYHPGFIAYTYRNGNDRAFDIGSTYMIIVICIYLITNYMRRSYYEQRESALEKAKAIEEQNGHIKAQRAALQHANEEKDKLFSIIAHDLRSPLNSIQSFLELLSENDLEQDEKLLIERELLTLTKNTSDMLYNLLSWSKAQMDGVSVQSKPLNIYKALEKTLEIQAMIADKKSIKLINHIDPAINAMADADMLQLVIRNLVNNAIKFTNDHGEILVQSATKDGECQLMVRDTGNGISFEQQGEIFSLKTKSTYGTNNEKGIGLGLILCKEFIELQGGRIWFQSTPKVGTAFYISLPLSKTYEKNYEAVI